MPRCAFVVSSLGKILSQDLIDITPSLGDLGPISLEAVLPLGMVDYHDLVLRLLCGQTPSYTPNGINKLSGFSETQASTVPIDNNAILSGGGGRCRYRVNEGSSSNPVPAHLRSASLDNGVSLRNNQVSRYGGSTSGYTRKPRGSIWGCYGPEQMRWQKGRKRFEGLERDFNESK